MSNSPRRSSRSAPGFGEKLERAASAFMPNALGSRGRREIVAATHRIRFFIGAASLATAGILPGAKASQRLALASLVIFVYLPWSLLLKRAARSGFDYRLVLGMVGGDLLIVFLFQALFPPTRIVALFGYLLIVAFYSYLGGRVAGLTVAGASMALTLLVHAADAGAEFGLSGYELTMYASVLISMALLMDLVSREQRASAEELQGAEVRSRLLMDQVPAMLWTTDRDLRITSCMGSGLAELGMAPEDVIGTDALSHLESSDPDDPPRVALLRALDGIESSYETEYRARTYQSFIHPWRDLKGNVEGTLGLAIDISARKAAEDAFKRAYEREREASKKLRDLDEMRNAFLQAVSHDLRTPLTSILGFSITLRAKMQTIPRDEATELLGRIVVNSERLRKLLLDLLDLDRLTRGQVEPVRRPTEMLGLIRSVLGDIELDGRRVVVEGEPVWAGIDASQVERIVENLVVNALRHTPDDTHVWVKVERHVVGGLTIIVEDDGPGVPDDEKAHIFEAFRQGGGGHASGSGLGLSLVARFAALHGGRAWATDRPGGGASFRVYLPGETTLEAAEDQSLQAS